MREFVLNGREEKVLNVLKRFGLNGYESRVYFTLLLLGRNRAYAIARRAGVPAAKVYQSLYSLADKGRVEVIENCPKEFEASGLEYLARDFVDEKKREALRAFKDADELRNNLESLRSAIKSIRTPIRVFTPRYRRAKVHDEDGF